METPETKNVPEICTITIVFPVASDDDAIEYKKKIGDVIKDIPDARVDFRIMTLGKPRERI